MALVTERYITPYTPALRLILGIGFLGAYTTFSTFAYETLMQVETAAWAGAALNLLASVAGGLLAASLGLRLTRAYSTRRTRSARIAPFCRSPKMRTWSPE